MISNPEGAGKRRRRTSKSRLSKKAARTRRRKRSPPQSVAPRDEVEEEDDGVAPEIFENLRGVIPERDAQELLVEMANLTKGFKAQSESAKTRASRMDALLMQVGKESIAMCQEAEEEKQLMRRENQLLKKTLDLAQTHQRPQGQQEGQQKVARDVDSTHAAPVHGQNGVDLSFSPCFAC